MRIRPADMRDSDNLFYLRNDPDVVRTSESQKMVDKVDHCLWLASLSESKRQKLWVVEEQGEKPVFIGYLRLDFDQISTRAEISIALKKEWRGAGIGTLLVDRIKYECAELGLKPFARVRSDNPASIKIFQKNGVEVYVFDSDHSRSYWLKASAE